MSLFGRYGSDYRRVVFFQRLIKPSREKAFEAAVGGAFDQIGELERDLLVAEGLRDDGLIVDIGCGAGRLAVRLRDRPQLSYVGIDVVPELLEFAKQAAQRPDWRFDLVSKTEIPCDAGAASMCAAFSVFTHLPENTCLAYLAEMRRVLKRDGVAVFSFLDADLPAHQKLLRDGVRCFLLTRTAFARNIGYSKGRISEWAARSGFAVKRIESPSRLGQSIAVFKRED
ncbi:MAG: class I SAM-dependent methyltransferase [Pseudomonadota bacterium]